MSDTTTEPPIAGAIPAGCPHLTGIGGQCCRDCHVTDEGGHVIAEWLDPTKDGPQSVVWGGISRVVCCVNAASVKARKRQGRR